MVVTITAIGQPTRQLPFRAAVLRLAALLNTSSDSVMAAFRAHGAIRCGQSVWSI